MWKFFSTKISKCTVLSSCITLMYLLFLKSWFGVPLLLMNFFYPVPNGPPQNCTSNQYNATAVELWWEEPLPALQNGQIVGYNLTCYCDSPCSNFMVELSAPQMSTHANITIVLESPPTHYTCFLSAINEVGEGPPTQCIFTTLEAGDTLCIDLGSWPSLRLSASSWK